MKRPELISVAAGARPALGLLPTALLDFVVVGVFVLVGRLSHDESADPAGLWQTAWPFLIGLAGGYVGLALTRWPASSLAGGGMVAAKTVILGLVVRYGIQGGGVALPFVVVATVVLTAFLLGGRLLARRVLPRIA